MENYSTQIEVLLMVGTTFSSRHYCEIEKYGNHCHLSKQEKLEVACWNAFMEEMLGQISSGDNAAEDLYLWKIRKASLFLVIEIGKFPGEIRKRHSIDPYYFLDYYSAN